MFKKLYENIEKLINESENNIVRRVQGDVSFNSRFVQNLYDKVRWCSEQNKSSKDTYLNTLQSQQRTIEQLLNALKDKYEHGLFIFSEDGKIPTVIRNGKELTNDLTTSFSIDWKNGEFPNINFEQIGGTHHDMEK